jgi:RNA recognition motif-containing protein
VGTKLYVGNLSYEATEAEIEALFAQAGEVKSVALITDRETGRPRGFGFVEMATEAEAQKAISMFNGHVMRERALKVSEARLAENRSGRGAPGGRDRDRGGFRGGRDRDRRRPRF